MEGQIKSYRDLVAWRKCGFRRNRTGMRRQAIGNRDGWFVFLCAGREKKRKFRPYCQLPNPSSLRSEASYHVHFLRIARGSAYELETQLVLAEDLGLCSEVTGEKVKNGLYEVIRVLQGLIQSLERRI